jgi:type III pantothenate kinase
MRTLLLDLGNTRLKWKFLNENVCAALTHSDEADAWQPLWQLAKPDHILLASVQAKRATELVSLIKHHWAIEPTRVQTPARFQLADGRVWTNAYAEPAKLGVDRFLAMIAAMQLFGPKRLCVSMVGTAQTIDVIEADGQHLGGLILPGPHLMRTSLHENTAALPMVDSNLSNAPWLGTNTDSAIALASYRAGAALVQQVCERYLVDQCVLSGGASTKMVPFVSHSMHRSEELVLLGIETYIEAKAQQLR